MKHPGLLKLAGAVLCVAAGVAHGDAPEPAASGGTKIEFTATAPTTNPTPPTPATISSPPVASWAFSATVSTYLTPNDGNYAQPTLTADHGRWHVEARYNYEALQTGSAWVGCNFSAGRTLTLEVTPMLGGVFGDVQGIAPGYSGTVTWWKLSFYSEGEYVIDTRDRSESFFYNWSELSISPLDWLRLGMVTQRTRVYSTERDIQRGILIGLSRGPASLTTYLFNPDDARPTLVVALAVEF